jgi:hypothetical protein
VLELLLGLDLAQGIGLMLGLSLALADVGAMVRFMLEL